MNIKNIIGMSVNIPKSDLKRIVVVGGGFAGLELVNRLRKSNYQIVLIDQNNFHQFLPLIYQVATAGLEPSSISFPFRKLFHNRQNFYFRMAEVRAVNIKDKIIQTSIGKLNYDYLVLAAGTISNYFGNKDLQEKSISMKTLQEALGLRNTLLSNFERALTCATQQERNELLNVVIVGGGATGVEIAGAIAEMKRYVFPKDYPDMDPESLKINLIEASPRLLGGMSEKASSNAYQYLIDMGVDIKLNTRLETYTQNMAHLDTGEKIATRSLIWVSGVSATPIQHIQGDFLGRGNRIIVDEYNQVKNIDCVFCIGDQCIQTTDGNYKNGHPQLAQVAIQQARNLAQNFKNKSKGKPFQPFSYTDLGAMATVGRKRAVADLKNFKIGGWFAWLLWLVIHLKSILGVRNKVLVLINWMWNYFTYDRSIRFIIYPKQTYNMKERLAKEQTTHLGEDLLSENRD